MKEAVYMLASRCLVLLTRVEGIAALFVPRPTGSEEPLERVESHVYGLSARFWQGEVRSRIC